MNTSSRIPKLQDSTFDGALLWFSELQCNNLLFHPEDDPADIISIANGERLFTSNEVNDLNLILNSLEDALGHDKVIEAAYPIFMNACGMQLDS